jgi:hypothetical protein
MSTQTIPILDGNTKKKKIVKVLKLTGWMLKRLSKGKPAG